MKKIINYREKGITLVALVITIIILLILAGVTLNTALSNSGLFERAKGAGEKYKEAEADESEKLNEVSKEMDKLLNQLQIKDYIGKKVSSNTTMFDENNNQITVPKNFKVVDPKDDSTVTYEYLEDKSPAVQDGIVIEDNENNQFVWIPVGNIKNKEKDEKGESTTTEIKLARRTFKDNGEIDVETEDGTKALDSYYIEETPQEHTTSGKKNIIAKDIEIFKKSVKNNHGYYIARYEAGSGNDGKPTSKEGAVWSNLTEIDAAQAAQKMYENNGDYTSDLVNSYEWDTALVFIQNYSGIKNYSRQIASNWVSGKAGPDTTGERGTTDKVCNIYDMKSNCFEWTTETVTSGDTPCSHRGGGYTWNNYWTSSRYDDNITHKLPDNGFRVSLYVL